MKWMSSTSRIRGEHSGPIVAVTPWRSIYSRSLDGGQRRLTDETRWPAGICAHESDRLTAAAHSSAESMQLTGLWHARRPRAPRRDDGRRSQKAVTDTICYVRRLLNVTLLSRRHQLLSSAVHDEMLKKNARVIRQLTTPVRSRQLFNYSQPLQLPFWVGLSPDWCP